MQNNPALKALDDKISAYLRDSGLHFESRQKGEYAVRSGSTMVLIRSTALEGLGTLVLLTAPVALECTNMGPQLGEYLAVENANLIFGKFSMSKEAKQVLCTHTLLGDFLDANELLTAVAAVVMVADKYDEPVAQMAGGKRMADM